MTIRPAIPADVAALLALERHADGAAHWAESDYDRLFHTSAPPRLCLVLEDEAGIQGFLVARQIDANWEIENIAVANPLRCRGFGTFLLRQVLDQAKARGAEAVFLEVRESNVAARNLYEKMAFVATGRRRDYYREPLEDAISYRLALI